MAGGPIIGLMKSVGESSSNQINIKLLFTKKILLTPMIAPSTQSYNLFGAFLACVTQQYLV
jgi:hypothetical protein